MSEKRISKKLICAIASIIIVIICIGGYELKTSYDAAVNKSKVEERIKKQKEKQKKIDGKYTWDDMEKTKLNATQLNQFKIAYRKFMEQNIVGDTINNVTCVKTTKVETGKITFYVQPNSYDHEIDKVTYENGKFKIEYYYSNYDVKNPSKKELKEIEDTPPDADDTPAGK